VPAVQRRVWLVASQLGISYRRGPLAPEASRWGRRPQPGDRVADLLCRRADGSEVTLHAGTAGCWVLVAADFDQAYRYAEAVAAPLGASMVRTLVPVSGGGGDVLLVRPDGHLAWRGRMGPGKLSAWLNETLWCG
jgi:4,5-epoxidase